MGLFCLLHLPGSSAIVISSTPRVVDMCCRYRQYVIHRRLVVSTCVIRRRLVVSTRVICRRCVEVLGGVVRCGGVAGCGGFIVRFCQSKVPRNIFSIL